MSDQPTIRVPVVRIGPGRRLRETDQAAAEEPLEIRVNGRPFAVVMRTPGGDRELAAGFLYAERVIRAAGELGPIEDEGDLGRQDLENVVAVTVTAPDLEERVGELRRVMVGSSCGLCGRTTIDALCADVPRIEPAWRVSGALIASLPDRLRRAQRAFDETGGLHAAGLFNRDGTLEFVAEDVGRHNAVDKIVGRILMAGGLPLSDRVLMVSGRMSYEIVQKALLAGIPMVAAVSAPSSLAIELAHEAGITLLGFVRGGTLNAYTHEGRIS